MSKKICILYGSETGNSEEYAISLSYKLSRYHFQHTLASLKDFNLQDLTKCRYLFIICSTTGQGELPRNAKCSKLWNFMKRGDLPNDFLNYIKIGFLGLGDSSYPHFQYAIKKLHKRMVTQLGAIELFPRFEADEVGLAGSGGGSVEAVYFEYEKQVLQKLLQKFPTRKILGDQKIKREMIDDSVYLEPKHILSISTTTNKNDTKPRFSNNEVCLGKVIMNKRITATDHFQDVRQFKFECETKFDPGDTVGIYPVNSDLTVDAMLNAQPHWINIADKPLELNNIPPTLSVLLPPNQELTLRHLLKYYFDICSIPKRTFFLKTLSFSIDSSRLSGGESQLEQQRKKLFEFATKQDMQDLYDYCNRPRRSILEVIQDFGSFGLPYEYIFDFFPSIKPRFYSISNCYNGHEMELTVAIVKYKTILHKIRKGLCTTYLNDLKENASYVRFFVEHNNLLDKMANYQEKPVILISPGVGIAPVKSIIESKIFSHRQSLFFGCRAKTKDYLYGDKLANLANSGELKLFICFSRDLTNSPTAKYVQDMLWENGEYVYDLIKNKNAYIYLCGSSGKMPIQVRLTLVEILKKFGEPANIKEPEAYLKSMEKNYRYLQETW
ncbi:NAPDH-dependent diflavin reductase SCDLUD_000777 [Saccharomycodes ludwigii]|uniref:NAPDH-dependent diflavin reductase n=1 Tax=Saccharomycodes ludwigii TaxID=36035 RepID=UPI001E821F54|nr:hypothetical protein SCDLUD_000777 [Saccharomycodes ludwigii]KAH3903163.1 hypothetical protein SCDLUD_000777 [Saccharomycodes ludwigii]